MKHKWETIWRCRRCRRETYMLCQTTVNTTLDHETNTITRTERGICHVCADRRRAAEEELYT